MRLSIYLFDKRIDLKVFLGRNRVEPDLVLSGIFFILEMERPMGGRFRLLGDHHLSWEYTLF